MIIDYKHIHPDFKLNNQAYHAIGLKSEAERYITQGQLFEKSVGLFLKDWLDTNDTITLQTSGSTGTPKLLEMKKQAMVNSALATGHFFNLQPQQTALLCLPTHYIAGKMMLVRAMVLGLHIDVVEPALDLSFDLEKAYDFCAMIPLQLEKNILNCDKIKTIIVGGAPMSDVLKTQVQNIKSDVFETYGMTETVTHIALKQINHVTAQASPYFKLLRHITISQNNNACLVIHAPRLTDKTIETNDIVALHSENEFEWLGRLDNVINSGGIKLFPEQIEKKLQNKISQRFFITSEADEALGSKVVLVLEGRSNILEDTIFDALNKYEKPKKIYAIKQFEETASGKIQRKKTLTKINL